VCWKNLYWKDTAVLLPPNSPLHWQNILRPAKTPQEGQALAASSLFQDIPVAFLHAGG
jgi:maltooligosyltrehalose synthase